MSDNPDFTVAGTPLYEWEGHQLDDATVTGCKEAVVLPREPFLVGIWYEPTDPLATWAHRQRRALQFWLKEHHGDLPGRLRLNTRSTLNPKTNQDCRIAYVTYDPKPRPKKKPADA